MSHTKRHEVPKNWPITRKGTKYVVTANSTGIPLLIALRDMLKISMNRKEVKKAIHEKQILLNGRTAHDEKNGVALFDTLTIVPMKKSYRMDLNEGGKFEMKEISEKEAEKKIVKIIGKKIQKGKKAQLNFSDGKNVLSNEKCKINDSLIINFKTKKIEKCIPLKEGANALVTAGKHVGEQGIIEKIDEKSKTVIAKVRGNSINVLIKQIIATE